MTKLVLPILLFGIGVAPQSAAIARSAYYVPDAGDTSQRSKCKSEASMMGVTGKGGDVAMESNRAMRKEYFKKCMQGH